MAAQIHVVRHAESVHNVTKNFSQLDPPLTSLGFEQAAKLANSFPHGGRVGIIITSPLRRAIQTALTAFSSILDKRYFDPDSGYGVENGVSLVIDPLLQERSALGCDTGSDQAILQTAFPKLNFEELGNGWPSKKGIFSAGDEVVHERAKKVRSSLNVRSEQLKNSKKRDIVIVTHGVFMKFLTEESDIDLPKAGWKSYTIEKGREPDVKLVAADVI